MEVERWGRFNLFGRCASPSHTYHIPAVWLCWCVCVCVCGQCTHSNTLAICGYFYFINFLPIIRIACVCVCTVHARVYICILRWRAWYPFMAWQTDNAKIDQIIRNAIACCLWPMLLSPQWRHYAQFYPEHGRRDMWMWRARASASIAAGHPTRSTLSIHNDIYYIIILCALRLACALIGISMAWRIFLSIAVVVGRRMLWHKTKTESWNNQRKKEKKNHVTRKFVLSRNLWRADIYWCTALCRLWVVVRIGYLGHFVCMMSEERTRHSIASLAQVQIMWMMI